MGNRTAIYVIILLLLLSACSARKFVPVNEKLYTGSQINVTAPPGSSVMKAKSEAKDILRPEPNSTFFRSRPQLWIYYKTLGDTSGLGGWLHRRLSKPPVYISQTDPSLLCRAIDARLFNLGYFDVYTSYTMKVDSQTASYTFTIVSGSPYKIGTIEYPAVTDSLTQLLNGLQSSSKIQLETQYNLDVLLQERERINDFLKNRGYFYFNPDYLLFKADTSLGQKKVKVKLELKSASPPEAKAVYTIKEVNIFAEYKLGKENTSEALKIDSVNFYSPTQYVRPAPVLQSVFLRNNKIYSRNDHDLTISRLSGLGVYKFVTVRLSKPDSAISNNQLNATILLTPRDKRSVNLEVQGVAKSNGFIGPGIRGGFRNRNALGGAELFIINAGASFETQLTGPYEGQYTYEFNPKIEFYVPRFMVPFHLRSTSLFVPKTKYIVDLSYLSRVNYYDIRSAKFSFGYKWKSTLTTDHDLTVLGVNYFNVYNQSDTFLLLLNENPTMALRFEKQLILGVGYSFTYNEQLFEKKRNPLYLNPSIEFAGSGLSAANKLMGKTPNATEPLQLLGVNYAQFVKLDLDIRQLFKLNKQGSKAIATRFFGGWGLPFGNASTMPYIKQYFSGGPYSLRGFPVYSVGPGTYTAPEETKDLYFAQQGGEIKLETNIEYRYTIAGMFKGAFFADAGNIWLNNANPEIPGGKFSSATFMKEIAVSVGTGIRFDLQYFVIRLDLGIPLRKPWYAEGNRWVLDEFALNDKDWRKNNLILNLAFGYPF